MRHPRSAILAALLVVSAAPAAQADVTLFIGANATPSNRMLKGVSIGVAPLRVAGFEFEYAGASADARAEAPSLTTVMGNVFVQTPLPIAGFQPYATAGLGGYSERLDEHHVMHLGVNGGGGVKVSLVGPLRARFDVRVLRLAGGPRHATARRVYAGLTVVF